jgi:hypothetical protein
MPVFNNSNILKSGNDIVLGSVYLEKDSFDFNIYENLLKDRVTDLIDIYVLDRVAYQPNSLYRITESDVRSDLAVEIYEKLNVFVSDNDPQSLLLAIVESEQFLNFLSDMRDRFMTYENTLAFTPQDVPVSTETLNEYFSQENVETILRETNIKEYIETLQMYSIPTLL